MAARIPVGLGPRCIDTGNPVADHPVNRAVNNWWLPLDTNQGASNRLFDLTTRSNFTLTNSPTWSPGRSVRHKSLLFNGSTQYGQASVNLTAFSAICVGFWINPVTLTTTNGQFNMFVELTTDGAVNAGGFAVYNAGTSAEGMTIAHRGATGTSTATYGSGNRPALSTWTHLLFVGDFGLVTNEVDLYKNGELLTPGNRPNNTNNTGSTYASSTLNLAARNAASLFTNARITDLKIQGFAPTASEAWAIYQDALLDHPNGLRRFTPTVWSFGAPATPSTVNFRKTLSGIGGRVGARQVQATGS